jgi:hypothetical protein
VNNSPIDLQAPDYTGCQGFEDLIPYTLGETNQWA